MRVIIKTKSKEKESSKVHNNKNTKKRSKNLRRTRLKKLKKYYSKMQIKVLGYNIDRLLNNIDKKNIGLMNIERVDHKEIIFVISGEDYTTLLKERMLREFDVKILKNYGIDKAISVAKNKIGVVVGVVVCMFMYAVASVFTFNIQILGINRISSDSVVKFLEEKGISRFKINDFNNFDIETMLRNQFEDISLVSVVKHGTNIIISIKEKDIINNIDNDDNIVAQDNLIIKKIQIFQGTSYYKVGDIVKAGDVLVYGYVLNDAGQKTSCKPLAYIECDLWVFGRVEFETNKVEMKRTGEKIMHTSFEIGGNSFFSSGKKVNYQYFEKEHTTKMLFKNLFIPIKLIKTVYYETKQVNINQDFESNKSRLIKESQQLAYKNVYDKEKILQESVSISEMGTKIIIQTSVLLNKIIDTSSV